MSEVDWNRYRDIVLQRMRAKYERMSDYLRALPTFVFQDPATMQSQILSPNDAIREVTNLSELGKKIIVAEINKMSAMQP